MTANAKQQLAERSKRIQDCVELREPDRVPFSAHWLFWPAKYAGITCQEAMYDVQKCTAALRKAVLDLEPDSYGCVLPAVAIGESLKLMGYKQLEWPGHGVDANASYQYLDREYMRADEYDDYLLDPTGFFLHKYLPRVADVFAPFERLPDFAANAYLAIVHATSAFSDPAMRGAFDRLAAAGSAMEWLDETGIPFVNEMTDRGFPTLWGGSSYAPYDFFADYLRGSKGVMLDMYRQPEKLLEAIERATRLIARDTISTVSPLPNKTVVIAVHWCPDGLMSPEQFEKFYWPGLRSLLMSLIDAGLTPHVLWEGVCDSRLETIGDIPPGKAIYHFERTDIFRAKKLLGDTVCLRGNVPSSMLTTGTPDEVDEYCKRLIDVCGRDGGLIVDGAIGIPDEARPENVFAMRDAVWKYGSYR